MFSEQDLVKYRTYSRLVDQLDWVIKGEAVVQTALLKQWFVDLEKKIIWAINESKPKASDMNVAKPLKIDDKPKSEAKKK